MSLNVGTLVAQLKLDTSDFTSGIKNATSESNSLSSSITNNAASIKKAGAVATVAGGAIVGAFGLATKASVDFESSMAEVYSLLPDLSTEAREQMAEDVRALSTEIGITTDEVVPALYQAISAGVSPDNVFDFLRTASEGSIGGVTDLAVAVDAVTTVVNAYGEGVITAEEANDQMFTAVKYGKVTYEELASTMYNVIPVAAANNVEFYNLSAAVAAMSANGTAAAQGTTQLKAVLNELSNPTTKAAEAFNKIAGVSFSEFMAQGHDLQDVFELLQEGMGGLTQASVNADISDIQDKIAKYKDQLELAKQKQKEFTETTAESTKMANSQKIDDLTANIKELETELTSVKSSAETTGGSIADVFSSVEAKSAVLTLTSEAGAEAFSTDLEAMLDSAGAAGEAADIVNESTARSIDQVMALFEEFKLQIGDVFLPVLKDQILPVLSDLLKTFGDLPDWVKPVILVIGGLGAALVVIGPLLIALPGMITAIGAAFTLLSANPIILAVGGLILLLIWLQKEFDILGIAVDVIGKIFEGWANIAKLVVNSIVSDFEWLWEQIKTIIDFAILAFQTFGKVVGAVADFISGVFDTIVGTVKSAINWVIDGVNTIIRGLNMLHIDIPDWLGGGTIGFNLSEIPRLAEGGIVTEPTIALVGEAGPEAVVPLNESGMTGGINITVEKMDVRNDNDIKKVAQELATLIKTQNRGKGVNYG